MGPIENLHILFIPLKDAQTGEVIFNIFRSPLEGLFGEVWQTKLLSIATNGVKNMTGRIQGAVTCFASVFYQVFADCDVLTIS